MSEPDRPELTGPRREIEELRHDRRAERWLLAKAGIAMALVGGLVVLRTLLG